MMQGEAGGYGGEARRNTRKRDLDDAPQRDFVEDNPSSKRRHTTSSPAHQDNKSTSKGSSFKSRRIKVEGNSQFSLRLPKSPLPQKYGSLNPPTNSTSAAEASGPSGALGGSWGSWGGASWGAKPSLPGGSSSGSGRKSNRNPLPDQPLTSSTTSSDASSIPAHSTGTSPFTTSKAKPQASTHSLRYGYEPWNWSALRQGWQSERQDAVLPSSRLNGTKETPHAITSSDDDLYVEGQDQEEEDDSDDNTFPTTRQRSTRLKTRSSTGSFWERNPDDGLNDEHGIEQSPYRNTPSGKDYHQLPDTYFEEYSPKSALFPDRYRLQFGPDGCRYPCPVRTCAQPCKTLEKLDNHFKAISPSLPLLVVTLITVSQASHSKNEFNDNLDEDGTLERVGRRESLPVGVSIIVSQKPRHPPSFRNDTSTLRPDREDDPVEVGSNDAPSKASDLRLDRSSSSGDSEDESDASGLSELERAMADSKVWAYVALSVKKSWATSITDDLEKRAFIQAISLPLKNKIDKEWLAGTKGSHQRHYRALMSVIFQVVGVEAHCLPCESKRSERRRNCKVLPPEAAGMRELQEVCGSQCVNCFFFHASKPCEFPGSSTTTKQTPVPVPVPQLTRSIPITGRPLESPPINPFRSPIASRPLVPPYSQYKTQKTEKPISESPVPIPSFAVGGPSRQSQPQDVSDEKPTRKPLRRSTRVSKIDGESGKGSDVIESYTTDEARSRPADPAASNDGPSKVTATSGLSSMETLTEAASNLSSGDISTSGLASRMFSLFGDIGRLPAVEQATLWDQMQQMSALLQTSDYAVHIASRTQSTSPSLLHGPPAEAGEWEIAPGRLVVDDTPMAFSTSFLSREVVSVKAAQQLSPNHRVLNKSIAALHQLTVGPEDGWKCTISVIRGLLKVKAGDVEARIGQGGLIAVEKKCIITNVSHKEAKVQVCWVEEV